jgi:hypothetical protein
MKYSDQPMDLADACLVRLYESFQHGSATIVTVDRVDFSIYRTQRGRSHLPHANAGSRSPLGSAAIKRGADPLDSVGTERSRRGRELAGKTLRPKGQFYRRALIHPHEARKGHRSLHLQPSLLICRLSDN